MRAVIAAVFASVLAIAGPAAAQTYLGSYSAWIGANDLTNSRGQRLWEPWQVIRQDRANYHRFGLRDGGDGGDPWFHDANARAQLEQAVIAFGLPQLHSDLIVQGSTWVQLDVYGRGTSITGVNIMVWR